MTTIRLNETQEEVYSSLAGITSISTALARMAYEELVDEREEDNSLLSGKALPSEIAERLAEYTYLRSFELMTTGDEPLTEFTTA